MQHAQIDQVRELDSDNDFSHAMDVPGSGSCFKGEVRVELHAFCLMWATPWLAVEQECQS